MAAKTSSPRSPPAGPSSNTRGKRMGRRLLRHWLHHPLRDHAAIGARHQAVAALADAHAGVHKLLRRFADVERITGRIALRNARPRDLSSLRDSLALLPELAPAV